MASWHDIEVALNSDSIESFEKAKLEALAKVEPQPSLNPSYHARFEQAQRRIARALERIDAKENAEKEEARHREINGRLEDLKRPHWTVKPNFWITVVSAIAAILAAYFAWRSLPPASSITPSNAIRVDGHIQSAP
jgi:hypothetical protein